MSVNAFKNIQVIEAKSAQDLMDILKKITVPYSIVQIYSDGSKHYAVVNTTFKIKVLKK